LRGGAGVIMVARAGFEPATVSFRDSRSYQAELSGQVRGWANHTSRVSKHTTSEHHILTLPASYHPAHHLNTGWSMAQIDDTYPSFFLCELPHDIGCSIHPKFTECDPTLYFMWENRKPRAFSIKQCVFDLLLYTF